MQGSTIDPIVAVQRIMRPMAVFFPLCSSFSACFLCYDHKHIIGDINKFVSIVIFRVEFPEVDFFQDKYSPFISRFARNEKEAPGIVRIQILMDAIT